MPSLFLYYLAALGAAPLFVVVMNLYLTGTFFVLPRLTDPKMLLVTILIYPIIEEVLFRGIIQEYIASKFSKQFFMISFANFSTSLLFALLHIIYHPVYMLFVFFPSLVYGYFKEQYKTLLAPITLHTFYNLCGYFIFNPVR